MEFKFARMDVIEIGFVIAIILLIILLLLTFIK